MITTTGDGRLGTAEAEAFAETYIDDHLADRTPEQLRGMAAEYLRLVTAVEQTMADLSDWDDDELTEVQRLSVYLDHLSAATRGGCAICRRAIYAPHTTTELTRRPWWHPRRWLDAAGDAWTGLRHDHRIAHSSCVPRRF